MLQLKGLHEKHIGEKVTVWDGKILLELEGQLGGRALFAGHGGIVPTQHKDYNILVQYVKNYFKCFEY